MTFYPSLKNALLFFAIGLVFGIFLSFLWGQMLIPEYKPVVTVESPKQLKKEVASLEATYSKKADSLNRQNNQLVFQLSNTKAALANANTKTVSLQREIFNLLDRRFTRKENAFSHLDASCDSLANTIPVLIAASNEKDSLYNSEVADLESQVQNRDSAVALQHQQYQILKESFTKSVEAQTILAGDNKALTKTVRQQRTKSKLLSVALFILSGAAATYLLHQ
ncbi:MAG: hypothetical protein EOO10_16730 [Chitinophagaceae bacterium]|nr:MAG: hypothetical protein EOO10_16730 [Chitinophagaceae bacterium]